MPAPASCPPSPATPCTPGPLSPSSTPPSLPNVFLIPSCTSSRCLARGLPTPHITWSLDGFPLPSTDRYRDSQYVTVEDSVISYLNLTEVSLASSNSADKTVQVTVYDGGRYSCNAANSAGSVQHEAEIRVFGESQDAEVCYRVLMQVLPMCETWARCPGQRGRTWCCTAQCPAIQSLPGSGRLMGASSSHQRNIMLAPTALCS